VELLLANRAELLLALELVTQEGSASSTPTIIPRISFDAKRLPRAAD